jgi:uncharacterized protein YndB with AHSA1/START domain
MSFPAERELSLTRLIDAPRAALFKAWTDPEILPKWFCPLPWKVSKAEMDVRPGGASCIVMNGPNGEEFPNRGIYLEVVENEKIVFTDAFVAAWEPSEKPFMVGIITFEDEGGKTRYTARVRHWNVADHDEHVKMGFHEGWGKATDQLEELVGAKS